MNARFENYFLEVESFVKCLPKRVMLRVGFTSIVHDHGEIRVYYTYVELTSAKPSKGVVGEQPCNINVCSLFIKIIHDDCVIQVAAE